MFASKMMGTVAMLVSNLGTSAVEQPLHDPIDEALEEGVHVDEKGEAPGLA